MKRMKQIRKQMAVILSIILCCSLISQQMLVNGEDTLIWEKADEPVDMIYGNGVYLKYQDYQLSYSKDGINWADSMIGEKEYYSKGQDLIFCGNFFWFSPENRGLWISKDGIHWEKSRPSWNGERVYTVIFRGGRYILLESDYCCGSGYYLFNASRIYDSIDGKNWREITDTQRDGLTSIINAKGMIIGVGVAGRISMLDKNFQWQEIKRVTRNDLYDIAYGNGCFIAVGDNETILKSTDGINWDIQQEERLGRIDTVDFSGDVFYAESYGTLFYNEDCEVGNTSWKRFAYDCTYQNGYLYKRNYTEYYAARLPESANTNIADLCLSGGFVSTEGKSTYKFVVAEQADSIELSIDFECNSAGGWIDTGDGKRYPIAEINNIPITPKTDEIIFHIIAQDGVTEEQYRAVLERGKIHHVKTLVRNGGFVFAPEYILEGDDLTLTAAENPGYQFIGWKLMDTDEIISSEKELQIQNVQGDVRYEAIFRVCEGNGISLSANTTCAKIRFCDEHDSSDYEEEEIKKIQLAVHSNEETEADFCWEVLNATDSYISNGELCVGRYESRQEIVVKVSKRDNPEICGYLPITIIRIAKKDEDTGEEESGTGNSTGENTGKEDMNGDSGNSGGSVSGNTGEENNDEDSGGTGGSVSENTNEENNDEDSTGEEDGVVDAGDQDDNGSDSDNNSYRENVGEGVDNNKGNQEAVSSNEINSEKTTQTSKRAKIKKGTVFYAGNLRYKITGYSKGGKRTVSVLGCKKQKRNIAIPGKIRYQGRSFQVTSIAAKAFYNKKKIRRISLGSNIKVIGKKAFSGIYAKAVIKCPKSKKIKYRKMIRRSGIRKTVQIK